VAPSLSFILVENGIDVPVHLVLASTYMATLFDGWSQELYDVAGRINEKYYNLLSSPWSAFLIEYQLPWDKELPDVRSIRSLSVKMLANSFFGEYGQEGALRDVASAFSVNTPVVMEPMNPLLWQPDLYQPITSGDDISGFDFHCWFPNLCLSRWIAFTKLMQNLDLYHFKRYSEEVVLVQNQDTNAYEQHVFDIDGPLCNIRGLLDSIGCMDGLIISGVMQLTADPSFCMWSEPFDMGVEPPGLGGYFFDSGTSFSGGWGNFDTLYDLDPLTDFWAGTSTTKRFDFGTCLSYFSDVPLLPKDQLCCNEGPDTLLLATLRLDAEDTAAVKPNHPLFGGDDPGLLGNPYFAI
jgi:hypothetical protein